jgi:tetratricopeptide (TPR) repeat protein
MAVLDRARTIQAAEKHVRAGKFLEAVAEYRKLADDNPRDMNVLNKLGDLLSRAGRNQEALRCFLRIADFYAKDGFFLKAIAMYKKISKLDPSNLDCQQQLAALYQKQGLAGEAKAQYLLLAETLMRKGQSQPAAEMLQKVLEIEPDNVKVRTTLGDLLGRGAKGDGAAREFCQAARAAVDRGAAAEAVQALRKAIKADPAHADLPGILLALVTKIEATPKDLAPLAEEVFKASPQSGPAAVAAAESYRRAGRRAEAEAAFKRLGAAESAPPDLSAEAMALVARWHTGAGRDAEGYEWLGRAVERFTSESRFRDAAAALDAYLQGHPVHRQALSARAAVAARAEDPEAEAATLLRIAPLLIESLELDRAGEIVERLTALRPGDPAVLELRSRLEAPAPESEAAEEPAAGTPLAADEEARSAEELFSIEEEETVAGPGTGQEAGEGADPAFPGMTSGPDLDATPGTAAGDQDISPEEAAYGPVSKIQEIQSADGDGQPIDEEFISEHLTEAEVFVKYGLLAKAREQLQAILERYPKEMTAHQRLIEVHAGEGNTELAVRECLLLADLKKAEGRDAEVRELVNEAIRIAGPGSPLVERYAAGLEAGGAAARSGARDPSARGRSPAGPAPAARAAEPKAAAPERPGADPDDLEIEIDVPEESETPAPAAPTVPDFAATTMRSAPIAPAGGEGGTVLSAIAQGAPAEPDSEKLGEVDFYVEQGLTDEARQVLFQLRKQYPRSRTVEERLQRLDQPAGAGDAPPADRTSPDSDLDFEVEQALGGRRAPSEPGRKESRPPGPKPSAQAAKARPVFKVEAHEPAGEGEFFDLARELDASLADEPERKGAEAPDTLDGPGHSFDEVLAAFRRGVEQQVDQEDYDTHYNLGIAYKEMGLVDEAIGEFQFAARDPSRTLECCGILGICFRDRGMPDLALKWYRRGLDMPGLDERKGIGLRYDMAEVYREKGDYEQALRMYMEVYGVDSNYRDVSSRIREVKGLMASAARR